jgi:ABC-type polar amino acid transport system ATPase subunit
MIAVRGLGKRYGAVEVLREVNLEIRPGEVAAVVGPSGAGKSTLLRCLNGLERFDRGEVAIGDLRLTPATHPRRDASLLRAVRLRLGFVFQQFHLFPHLTVLENVIEAPIHVLGLRRDEAVARARGLLERVGLGRKLGAFPRHLSGGEQQRVAIARALAMQPQAILFDEPTSALDPGTASEVLEVIGDLAAAGQTMVLVTHALRFARRAAHTVHVFCSGTVVESGRPEDVLETPRHPETQRFLERAR